MTKMIMIIRLQRWSFRDDDDEDEGDAEDLVEADNLPQAHKDYYNNNDDILDDDDDGSGRKESDNLNLPLAH